MRVWDVDGTGLAFPGARFGRGCVSSSVSAAIVRSMLTTVAQAVCRALKYVFVHTNIMQSCEYINLK
jgi:hypothetical protein